MKQIIEMTHEEWKQRGRELFGDDPKEWRFVCPSCGHVQTFNDFLALDMVPEDVEKYVGFSCIGRFDGHGDTDICSGKSPCNYTAGGLLNINPIKVIIGENHRYVFAFEEDKS